MSSVASRRRWRFLSAAAVGAGAMLGLQALAKKKGGDKAEKAAAAAGLLLAGYCVGTCRNALGGSHAPKPCFTGQDVACLTYACAAGSLSYSTGCPAQVHPPAQGACPSRKRHARARIRAAGPVWRHHAAPVQPPHPQVGPVGGPGCHYLPVGQRGGLGTPHQRGGSQRRRGGGTCCCSASHRALYCCSRCGGSRCRCSTRRGSAGRTPCSST